MLVIALSIVAFLFWSHGVVSFLTTQLEQKIDISVYLNPNIASANVDQIKSTVAKIKGVREVDYIPPSDVLKQFEKRHQDDPIIMESLSVIGENPFYPTLNIRAVSPDYYASILSTLEKSSASKDIYKVNYVKKKNLVQRLSEMTANASRVGIALSVFLGLIALIVAFSTIKSTIKDSGKEISIMKLVGASNFFVRGPFIVQGVIWGVLAVITTFLLLFAFSYFSAHKIALVTGGFNSLAWFYKNALSLFGIQLAIGVGLTVFLTWIAVRKYLKI